MFLSTGPRRFALFLSKGAPAQYGSKGKQHQAIRGITLKEASLQRPQTQTRSPNTQASDVEPPGKLWDATDPSANTGRKSGPLPKQLGSTHSESMGPQNSEGIPHRMAENPLPDSPSYHKGEFPRGVLGDTGRSAEPAFEASGCTSSPLRRPIHQSALSGGKERWNLPSSYQPETSKSPCHCSPFQNGRI